MPAPDFSTYTEAQLRQVLSRIDRTKYPERVRAIEARLADSASSPRAACVVQIAPVPMTIAGLVPRMAAFLIDALLLGALGWTAGLFLRDHFARLGPWGVTVGFAVAFAYFGITESGYGGGQSVGKRILGLRVVNGAGIPLDKVQALCRTLIFCGVYFLNGIPLVFGDGNRWAAVVQSALVCAAMFSIPYLIAFNRRTHQAVHDLATGAFVVHAGTGPRALPVWALWRGHLAVIGTVAAALLTGSAYLASRLPRIATAAFENTGSAVTRVAGLGRPTLIWGTLYTAGTSTTLLSIQVPVDISTPHSPDLALRVIQTVFDNYPDATNQQGVNVVLRSGYDIGIARSWTTSEYTGTPDEWRARLAAHRD